MLNEVLKIKGKPACFDNHTKKSLDRMMFVQAQYLLSLEGVVQYLSSGEKGEEKYFATLNKNTLFQKPEILTRQKLIQKSVSRLNRNTGASFKELVFDSLGQPVMELAFKYDKKTGKSTPIMENIPNSDLNKTLIKSLTTNLNKLKTDKLDLDRKLGDLQNALKHYQYKNDPKDTFAVGTKTEIIDKTEKSNTYSKKMAQIKLDIKKLESKKELHEINTLAHILTKKTQFGVLYYLVILPDGKKYNSKLSTDCKLPQNMGEYNFLGFYGLEKVGSLSQCYLDELQQQNIAQIFQITNKDLQKADLNSLNNILNDNLVAENQKKADMFVYYWQKAFEQSDKYSLGSGVKIMLRTKSEKLIVDKRTAKLKGLNGDQIFTKKRFSRDILTVSFAIKINSHLLPIADKEEDEADQKDFYKNKIAQRQQEIQDFNDKINSNLKNSQNSGGNFNIIGVDRGVKSLAFACVINQNKEIVHLEDLTNIGGVEFAKKLDKIKTKRDNIFIKNIKSGTNKTLPCIKKIKQDYAGEYVAKITDLMLKYNAVLAYEDLDSLKQSMSVQRARQSIEGEKLTKYDLSKDQISAQKYADKTVYQDIEFAIIQKLTYLSKKNDPAVQRLQIVPKLQKLEDIKNPNKKEVNQWGAIFYVDPAYTSRCCPDCRFNKGNTTAKLRLNDSNFFEEYDFVWNAGLSCFDIDMNSYGITLSTHKQDMFAPDYVGMKRETADTKSLTLQIIECLSDVGISYLNCPSISNYAHKLNFKARKELVGNLRKILLILMDLRCFDIQNKDYILCPVCGFDSREVPFVNPKYVGLNPQNFEYGGDANGAYNIAIKALDYIKKIHILKPI